MRPKTTEESKMDRIAWCLRCPVCHSGLEMQGTRLRCTGCADQVKILKGRPVFLPKDEEPSLMPDTHVSNQLPADVLDYLTWLDGWALNIGAGGTKEKFENCIEFEHAIFRNTDVVGDAHHLPFADDSFEAVITFNTFEHLMDPNRAASEVYRVLKPGGKLILRTAFLQPVHEAPHHYYNTTEYGLRNWFNQFDISELYVSDNFNPSYVFAWLASEMIRAVQKELGQQAAEKIASSSLGFWQSTWEKTGFRDHELWNILRNLSDETQKRCSAGFHLEATKPQTN